jgi:diguanylate cyclase (GGDEF)-like protein
VPSMIHEISFKIANERDSELEACEILDHFAKKCDFLPESIDEMRLAFIEAIINAKEHAPKDIPGGQKSEIGVGMTYDGELLTIQVRDYGKGFDPGTVEAPDIKKKLKSANKRGWGLMLMERLMDAVEIASFPPTGTLIKMIKKRLKLEPPPPPDTLREHKRIERLRYVLGSFIDLSSFLCQNRDLESGLRSMLRILLGTLGVSRGAIYIFDTNHETAKCLVDIKLKARDRFPLLRVTNETLQEMVRHESLQVVDVLKTSAPEFFQAFNGDEVESIYLLRADQEILGLLVLGARFRAEEAEVEDVDLLSTLSRNISTAINTFRLMDQLKSANQELDQRLRELQMAREASQTISGELELENLPFTVERIFKATLGIGAFSLALFDPTENRYSICQTGRELPTALDLWSSPVSRFVIQKMEPLFVADIDREPRFQFTRSQNYSTRSFIVIPIVVQEEVLGLVSLTDKTDGTSLTERDFNLAQLLSAQLGIALKNANLYKLGITDGLTRLYTQHYFKMRLAQEISRVRRVKSPLSLVIFDMDRFAALNQTHGDDAGDFVLAKVAGLFKRLIRFNDIPCRFGGEKFALILPDTHVQGAAVVAEKLRAAIAGTKYPWHQQEIRIEASFGVAAFEMNMSLEQAIDVGESLLREAKGKGGNLVITSTPAAVPNAS